jgi:hypothetical protein
MDRLKRISWTEPSGFPRGAGTVTGGRSRLFVSRY